MRPAVLAGSIGVLLVAGMPAVVAAQSGRVGAMPSPAPARQADQARMIVLNDGSVVADFGRGYERVIRSCDAYYWNARHLDAYGRPIDPAPQGGSAQRPPGANGLPAAPGQSPVPDQVGRTRLSTTRQGTAAPSAGATSGTTLQPRHSGWRTVGPAYYDRACYARDQRGRVRLIHF